jgi:hypothetical protein
VGVGDGFGVGVEMLGVGDGLGVGDEVEVMAARNPSLVVTPVDVAKLHPEETSAIA